MSYYNQPPAPWSPTARSGPWEPSTPASHASPTTTGGPDETDAFFYQIASVDRALEVWRKGSKQPGGPSNMSKSPTNRSDIMTADPRFGMPPPQHRFQPNPTDFDPHRAPPSAVPPGGPPPQPFYPGQQRPHAGPRSNDVDPAKRRMAAQRERDLRNFHQEQQIQKHLSSNKSDRSLSPNAPGLTEEDRRDLLSRQHRALYGDSSSALYPDPSTRPAPPPGAFRNSSPYDSFPPSSAAATSAKDPKSSRANSPNSPSTGAPQQQQQQQPPSTSTPPVSGAPSSSGAAAPATAAVAPIGTRPAQQQQQQQQQQQPQQAQSGQPASGKRSTTPGGQQLASPLGFGFNTAESKPEAGSNQAAPNSGEQKEDGQNQNLRGPWGAWGGKGGLGGVQAKVWG